MKKHFLGATTLALFLLGCNDPKEANKDNFEIVINKYLIEKKDTLTCTKIGNKFPLIDQTGLKKKHLQKYVELGLLTVETEVKIHKGALMGQDMKDEINTYDLTEFGKEHYKNEQFCFGTPIVDEIISFMEPKDFMGKKVTEVKYKFKLKNLPDWYKIDTVKEQKINLILEKNGWEYK